MAKKQTPGRTGAKKQKPVLESLPRLTDLLTHLKISQWDTLVVGDGSGVGWTMGAGWASVLVDRASYARKLFFGGMNTGTVTLGELFPYLHALSWYTGKDGPGRKRQREIVKSGRSMQVHLVTDSQIIATAGNNPESRHAHQELWAAFDAYRNRGFSLQFHYVARDRIGLNVLVDEISRQARIDVKDTYKRGIEKLRNRYPGLPRDATIYDFSH